MRTIVSIGAQSGSPHSAWKGRFARDRFGTPGQPITSGEEKRGSRFRAPNAGKTRTAPPTRGAVRRVIGFATYLLHVHDAASRREVLRGDVSLDPALDFEESSLWRARVGVKQVSVRVWVRTRVLDQSAWTLEKLGRSGGSTHLAALVLLSLRGGGHLERPPNIMRDRGCAPKCGSRRGFLRGRKCAGGRGPSGENLQLDSLRVVIARVSGLRSSSTFHDLLLLDARSSCGVRPETRALGDHAGADARR